jgi:hypothetical protein
MTLASTHPLYEELKPDWDMLRDCYAGESVVKAAGHKYLPVTPGQVLDGYNLGAPAAVAAYTGYKARAVFPDFFEVGVRTLIGILNAKDPMIHLPAEMEFMRSRASLTGDTLAGVLRKIHAEQLIVGRAGIIADMQANASLGNDNHYLQVYPGERVLNWDDGSFNDGYGKLNMVVLDESGYERDNDFSWNQVKKYRVLTLGEIGENTPIGAYRSGVSLGDREVSYLTPMYRGQVLDRIPFVFANATDISPEPARPPLLGLANLCMVIYRGEADYRNTLFLQGQDTLVVVGGLRQHNQDDPLRIGAGARIDVEMGGDVKYAGIGPGGLPEQRLALESDRQLAAVRTGQLLAPGKMSMESGEALKTRVAAQTATLTSVAVSSAAALEEILRIVAIWKGLDPAEVTVVPNLDFTNIAMNGQDLVQMMTAKNLGAPLSYRTIHAMIRERGVTRASFEEELELLKQDPEELKAVAANAGNVAGNNPLQAAGGPTKKPDIKDPVSNKPAN